MVFGNEVLKLYDNNVATVTTLFGILIITLKFHG